ncbi:MOSC domain-containing protein [Celerinatantimonas diazotrophica]|uniref:MOSC domain-containing protein n=1 Tax=Celerinatantimonas diazotrophica TaxID=412034 RepID=A0A4R1K3C8_9GAMM|nr:MOSC domain-containing protein [Celerinatantimonas diazotrophica]TCK58606.1 hypothetical protein EV690_0737 [Celerinatantimonas diazotrophica]CAG9297235.1 hypothetical protein CEDIAZO_02405 [Celerinatantimonas diazotrophica]
MAKVVSVSKSHKHVFSKETVKSIMLIQGEGVEGDAHQGKTVQHRSRVRANPTQPNLRQVHLIHHELFDELYADGFTVEPGSLGENITTQGLELLSLPKGTILTFPSGAQIAITGLRNPCSQIEHFQNGLFDAVLSRDNSGRLVRKAGVMAIVLTAGQVNSEDDIAVTFPEQPFEPLRVV